MKMRRRAVDASAQWSGRSSPPDTAPAKRLPPLTTAAAEPMVDGWERQDGYHRQLAITVSPAPLASYGGVDGCPASFAAFIRPLVRPPFAALPTDPRLLVPVFAVSESETLLPLTDPSSAPTSGVATRTELARHADATFEAVTGRSKADVQLPTPTQPQPFSYVPAARQPQSAQQADQSDASQRKRKRDPSPARGPLSATPTATAAAEPLADDGRRAKHLKTEALAPPRPTALSPIDEITPRNGRHASAGKRPATSPLAQSRTPSRDRERSASRSRAFEREHNPTVSQLHMPEHTERAWAARRRRLQHEQLEAGVDEDDDTDSLEQLIYPSPFTLLRRQRRRFATRMTDERNKMQDLWTNLCYRVRLEQDAREMEKIEEEVQEEATNPSPDPDTHTLSTTVPQLPDPASIDHEHKSRRRRERSHVTMHANDWMKADNKFIKLDIDQVRRAILEAEAVGISLTTLPSSRSTTPASSPAPSPRLVGHSGKTDASLSLADVRAELAQSNPPSPTPSLMSLSPPSSRSVSPLPSLRTHSTDTLPAHDDLSPNSALTDYSSLPDTHTHTQLAAADKHALRSLTQPHSHPAGRRGCLVEAIIAHRQLHTAADGKDGGAGGAMSGDRAADWLSWRDGVPCEYLVQWVESEERTWERADQLQAAMVDAYWDGRGQQLWDEKDISELHRILKAHLRQTHAPLSVHARM